MKIFFVINKWDDGAFISEDETECDVPFASYEAAVRALARLDEVDYTAFLERETNRETRYRLNNNAREILDRSGFLGIDQLLYNDRSFEPQVFESKYMILQVEVME